MSKEESLADPQNGVPFGIHFALAGRMDLYDVKMRGFPSVLNSGEISLLFRIGQIDRRLPCKPRDEATWRTIDELFPLLKSAGTTPRRSRRARERGPFYSSSALIIVLLGIAIVHFCRQSPSIAGRRSEERNATLSAERVVTQLAQTASFTNSNRPARLPDRGIVIADQRRIR